MIGFPFFLCLVYAHALTLRVFAEVLQAPSNLMLHSTTSPHFHSLNKIIISFSNPSWLIFKKQKKAIIIGDENEVCAKNEKKHEK